MQYMENILNTKLTYVLETKFALYFGKECDESKRLRGLTFWACRASVYNGPSGFLCSRGIGYLVIGTGSRGIENLMRAV